MWLSADPRESSNHKESNRHAAAPCASRRGQRVPVPSNLTSMDVELAFAHLPLVRELESSVPRFRAWWGGGPPRSRLSCDPCTPNSTPALYLRFRFAKGPSDLLRIGLRGGPGEVVSNRNRSIGCRERFLLPGSRTKSGPGGPPAHHALCWPSAGHCRLGDLGSWASRGLRGLWCDADRLYDVREVRCAGPSAR